MAADGERLSETDQDVGRIYSVVLTNVPQEKNLVLLWAAYNPYLVLFIILGPCQINQWGKDLGPGPFFDKVASSLHAFDLDPAVLVLLSDRFSRFLSFSGLRFFFCFFHSAYQPCQQRSSNRTPAPKCHAVVASTQMQILKPFTLLLEERAGVDGRVLEYQTVNQYKFAGYVCTCNPQGDAQEGQLTSS